jgi:hypothetical protein
MALPAVEQAIDLMKEHKALYSGSPAKPVLMDVPSLSYLAVDGAGDPNIAAEFRDAISALYSVAYGAKFTLRKRAGIDFKVMPLEALWWTADDGTLDVQHKDTFQWTALIMVPPCVDEALVREEQEAAFKKKGLDAARKVRLITLEEGTAAQVLHLGPYDAEAPTIARLHEFVAANGLAPRGKHHEIYLGDPNRTAPEKLRTIIRQPVQAP